MQQMCKDTGENRKRKVMSDEQKAEGILPTSIKEKETPLLKRVVNPLHHKTGKRRACGDLGSSRLLVQLQPGPVAKLVPGVLRKRCFLVEAGLRMFKLKLVRAMVPKFQREKRIGSDQFETGINDDHVFSPDK
eukprot:1157391-Pelagomonas_calceolata.AAC.4